MLKLTRKAKMSLFMTLFAFGLILSMAPARSNASTNAVALSLSSSSGTVGFPVSVHATGLTDGTCYLIVAAASTGNVTGVTSCSGTEDYVVLTFTQTDADNIVPIHIGTTTDYSSTAAYTATVLYTLTPATIPGQQFFTAIIGGLVIIAVVVGLAGIFKMKRMKS